MSNLKFKIREWRAKSVQPLASAAPYVMCVAILTVGVGIGYAGAKIESTDQINRLNEAHAGEIIRLQASYKPIMELLGVKIEEIAQKALQASQQAQSAASTAKAAVDGQKGP